MNEVILCGYLVKNPKRGKEKGPVSFNILTELEYQDESGESKVIKDTNRVVVWNNLANYCMKNLEEGNKIELRGRLSTRSWTDQNGEKKYITEVIAHKITLVAVSKEDEKDPKQLNFVNEDIPF